MKNWEEGLICPSCGEESFRFINGHCFRCEQAIAAEREEKMGEKRERRYYKEQLRKGKISLSQMREGRL